MDPLQWFQQNVINKAAKGAAIAKPGGAIVPTTAGQLLNPTGIQQITTNLRVPSGGAVPGGGIGMLGARGQNFGIIDKPMDKLTGEVVRGAMTVLGKDTENFSKYLDGQPVVKNIGGTSFNVSTPEGQRGYKKAIEAGKEPSTPKPSTTKPIQAAGLDTGTGQKDVKDPMAIWAEKYKDTLAPKVKPGQAGYDTIQDVLGTSTQDQRDAVSDRMVMGGNAAESMAGAKGANLEVVIDGAGPETVTINPQGFKDDAMAKVMNNFGQLNIEPMIGGMTLPTTTNYAGAFNQTDKPYANPFKDTGVMDEITKTYGTNNPLFTQGRNFRSLF